MNYVTANKIQKLWLMNYVNGNKIRKLWLVNYFNVDLKKIMARELR